MTFKVDQDESLRLWNTQTGICILIFAGAGGHRNEILSVVSVLSSVSRPFYCLLTYLFVAMIYIISGFWRLAQLILCFFL